MRNSSVEAMHDFGSLLRKRPAGLIVTLRIDEDAAPNRKLHFFRSTLLAGNVSLRGAQMKEVFPVASLSFGEILKELKTLQARLNSWKFTP